MNALIEIPALGNIPDLRQSDEVNLADERVPCPLCDGGCEFCKDKGHVTAPTGRDHLSHSMLTTMLSCPQKYGYSYDDRIEPLAKAKPLTMGTAFQHAIEVGDPKAGALMIRAGAHPMSQDEENALRVDETTVRAAASLYLDVWPAPTCDECGGTACDACDMTGTKQVREYEFRVRLRNPWTGHYSRTFDLLGYADGLEDHGAYYELIENKFVGQISETGVRKLKLDRQVGLVAYGIWRATGKPVRRIRYRYTRKPTIKQKGGRLNAKTQERTGAETIEEFCARIEADYADPERREFYTHQENLIRSADDLARTEAELWRWAEQVRDMRRAGQRVYPRNTSHCHDFGGCPFIPLCVGDPDAKSLYRVRETRDRPNDNTKESDVPAAT